MATTLTVADLATEANKFLYRSTEKKSESTYDGMILRKDDAPKWVDDLCMAAHNAGEIGPDDWRYEFIQDALNALENGDEDAPDVDTLYPYTRDRLNWISSNLLRPGYCDEAAEEYDMKTGNVLDLIALGMYGEVSEVFHVVKTFLEERADQLAEEEPADVE